MDAAFALIIGIVIGMLVFFLSTKLQQQPQTANPPTHPRIAIARPPKAQKKRKSAAHLPKPSYDLEESERLDKYNRSPPETSLLSITPPDEQTLSQLSVAQGDAANDSIMDAVLALIIGIIFGVLFFLLGTKLQQQTHTNYDLEESVRLDTYNRNPPEISLRKTEKSTDEQALSAQLLKAQRDAEIDSSLTHQPIAVARPLNAREKRKIAAHLSKTSSKKPKSTEKNVIVKDNNDKHVSQAEEDSAYLMSRYPKI